MPSRLTIKRTAHDQIHKNQATNWVGLFFFNIPDGTLLFLVPGLCFLFIGVCLYGTDSGTIRDHGQMMSTSWLMIMIGLIMFVTGLCMCMWSVYQMFKYKKWLGLTKEGVHKDPELMRVFSVYSRPKRYRREERRSYLKKQKRVTISEGDCDDHIEQLPVNESESESNEQDDVIV